jgi:hypothetical protein
VVLALKDHQILVVLAIEDHSKTTLEVSSGLVVVLALWNVLRIVALLVRGVEDGVDGAATYTKCCRPVNFHLKELAAGCTNKIAG